MKLLFFLLFVVATFFSGLFGTPEVAEPLPANQPSFAEERLAEMAAAADADANAFTCGKGSTQLSRSDYARRLRGFWLGQCIANWTGLRTENVKTKPPFYTDDDWGTMRGRKSKQTGQPQLIDFVLVDEESAWGADDDTDIEYIHQAILEQNDTTRPSGEQIRDGWLRHIKTEEQNYLWVSNERALHLMVDGMVPPETSDPDNNEFYDQIDAQLTTEIFGLFAPTRPDIAVELAHLPIRTTAYREAEWISEFYVVTHSLASSVESDWSDRDKTRWLAEQARKRLPDDSYPARMFDFVKAEYEANPDKDNWEQTRDRLHQRYAVQQADGYTYKTRFDAGINFGASLVSLFYGEGDFKRTVRIGTLCGWDSDNPTATWGGLIGFLIGDDGVAAAFPNAKLSRTYFIGRTRINFPVRTPDQPGDDTFELMAERGLSIVDRVVAEELGGSIDRPAGIWCIPRVVDPVQPASAD